MMFRGNVAFQRLKIRSKTANVAEIKVEKVEEGVMIAVRPGDINFMVPSPEGDSEAGVGVASFHLRMF